MTQTQKFIGRPSKLLPRQKEDIIKRHRQGVTQEHLARLYKVHRTTIQRLCSSTLASDSKGKGGVADTNADADADTKVAEYADTKVADISEQEQQTPEPEQTPAGLPQDVIDKIIVSLTRLRVDIDRMIGMTVGLGAYYQGESYDLKNLQEHLNSYRALVEELHSLHT